MKKKLFSIIISAAVLLGGAGMAACNSTPSQHEHIWNDGEITVQPSCKKEGEKTYGCTVSGCKETKTERVDKTAHTWDGGSVTEEPSCTETGLKTFTCTVCDETRAEPIDKTAHNYDGGTLTVIPTLTAKGETTFKCGDCDDIKKESVAPRDDFGEHFYTSVAEASVWQYGYAEQYNSETGEFVFKRIARTDEEQPAVWKADGVAIEKDKIYSANYAAIAYPADGDMHLSVTARFTGDEEETRLAASLSVVDADGKVKGEPTLIGGEDKDWNFSTQEEISVVAGDTLYLVFINGGSGAPSGTFGYRLVSQCRHMWGEGEVTQPASCTEYGETTYTCNLCGQSKTEAIPMTNHDFTGDWTETEGGHTRKCAECGTADTVSVVPHAFTEDADKRVPSTCHSDGVRTMVCSDCGAVTTEAITERPEHSLGDWQAAEGGHRKVCTVDGCGYVGETELHNMKDGEIIKEPTATEKGEKKSICSDCGYTEIIEIPTTDHIASEEYGKDNDYHWNICGAHADCGERVNQTPHDYKELTHLREEPTCGKDGKSFWECVCGATKEEVVSKNTVPHDFVNAEYADEGDGGHHLICNVCGAAGESVAHTYGEGEITTEPTFWEEGVKTSKCVCGHVAEEAVARKNSTSADVNDQDWKFGVVNYHFPDETDSREYFTFNQITDENGDGDGYSKDGTEIKNNWFCGANFDTFICMAYTFKEDVDAEITVTFKGIGGDDGVLSDYSLRIGYNQAPEWGDRGTEFTVNKTHNFKAGDTVYFIFKHETDGWDQGNYSITINRAVSAQN